MRRKKTKLFLRKKYLKFLILAVLAVGLILVWRFAKRSIEITNQPNGQNEAEQSGVSPISGLICENYQQRPIAVVLASDPISRPLAGISQADLVFEMPVITNDVTRMIAVYQCQSPKEIGSIRSARHDFIPLTMGLDAILVHWGGSHFALDKLDNGVMDNIDAMENPFNAFYQKRGIPQPHNGFSSMDRLLKSAAKLNYRLTNNFEGYPHQEENKGIWSKILKIGYASPYNVEYRYDSEINSYFRWRAGAKEIDKNNNQQVEAKVVVVMRAYSRQIEGPEYNDLDIEGRGDCQVYQNGEVINCTWKKDKSNQPSKLYFLDKNGEEIPFVPGQIWIEIVEPGQKVSWE